MFEVNGSMGYRDVMGGNRNSNRAGCHGFEEAVRDDCGWPEKARLVPSRLSRRSFSEGWWHPE
jgi:hypothetical protein